MSPLRCLTVWATTPQGGVDQIIAETGIAKNTMYRHFKSKDTLIVAALKRIDATFRDDMRNAVDARAGSEKKLLATFDFLEERFRGYTFCGCPFMSTADEYNDRTFPVFQETLLHERATAVAQINGDPITARKVKAVTTRLIDDASADLKSST